MKRLALSVLVLAALLFTVDRVVGRQLAVRFRVSSSDEADAIGRGLAARAPVVICGSSRALHHYDPQVLEQRLGVPAWNFGRDGQFASFYPYAVTELMLEQYAPRLLILEVDEQTFAGRDPMATLNVLLPYANDHRSVAELVNHRSRYERIKRWSRIYPYNSLLLSLYGSGAGFSRSSARGFSGLQGEMSEQDASVGPDTTAARRIADRPPVEDALKMRYLRQLITELRAHRVAVVAMRGPHLLRNEQDRDRDRRIALRVRACFDSLGVREFDFSTRTCAALNDRHLFWDWSHLNGRGAAQFSSLAVDSIATLGLPGLPGLAAARHQK